MRDPREGIAPDGTTRTQSSGKRWGEVHPHLAFGPALLASWAEDMPAIDRRSIERALDERAAPIVGSVGDEIGFWSTESL